MTATKNQWVSQPGDLWHLGKHRLMCADSLSIAALTP